MRDRRDYLIAAMAAALLFCLGVLVGQGGAVLPGAQAQDSKGFDPETPVDTKSGSPAANGTSGVMIGLDAAGAGGRRGGTTAYTATDSNSNNRFVAVTSPIGSGESALFVLDSKNDQLVVYRFRRGHGLEFLAGRKIDYDLRINQYEDISKFSRDELKREFEKQLARAAAEAAKQSTGG